MLNFLSKITLIEALGVGFSIVQVLLAKKNKSSNYFFGIIGILLTLWILFQAGLFAEFALNIYYLLMSIYGWLYWNFGKNKQEVFISKSTKNDFFISLSIVAMSFILFYFLLQYISTSNVIFWDCSVSAFAWAGMWLMAKRKIENWIFLNISNFIAIGLYFYKELYLYAFLSLFLFIIACFAYFEWKVLLNKKSAL